MKPQEQAVLEASAFASEARDLAKELKATVKELSFCLRHTRPTKQFLSELLLGAISLQLTAKNYTQAGCHEKKAELAHEFDKGSSILRLGMGALWERAGIRSEDIAARAEALALTAKRKVREEENLLGLLKEV